MGISASGGGAAGAAGGSVLIAAITAASSAIANTEALVVHASLAANSLVAGMSFRIRASGVGTTGLTPGNDTFNIRVGPTTLTGNIPATVAPAANASVTAQAFSFDAIVTLRTAGASGTIIGGAEAFSDNITTGLFTVLVDVAASTSTVAIDTTVANLIELTFVSGAAGSSCTFHVATIEQLTSGPIVGGGGGGITHAYLGYNTAGGSLQSMGQRVMYCAPITPGSAGWIGSISAYLEDDGASHVADLHVAIFDDNSGVPGKIIAFGGLSPLTSFLPFTTYGQRWVAMPIGYWAASGVKIWISVGSDATNPLRLAYDTSGGDYVYTNSGDWVVDATISTPTNSTHKHSIRADLLT